MDEFLLRLGYQAMNQAMRCGISLTSTFAVNQCSRLLKTVDNKKQHKELEALQKVLNSKIKIVSPALDLIEFKSGRGNVFLGNAAALAKELHRDIVALGKRLENAAATEELAQKQGFRFQLDAEQRNVELFEIIRDIKKLLVRIDSDIPLLQLAITASGESLSTALPPSISPSRLLQASMFLVVGDTQFSGDPCRPVQIGPSFTLSLYMLFLGHSTATSKPKTNGEGKNNDDTRDRRTEKPYGVGPGERKPIWQEVLHKARVRICRTPPGWEFHLGKGFVAPKEKPGIDVTVSTMTLPSTHEQVEEKEYVYYLEIIEDLDDGRAHDDDISSNTAYDGISHAGVQEAIPVYQISKLFYTDSGRILNIGTQNGFENKSVLLLKRDTSSTAPTKSMEHMEPGGEDREEPNTASSDSESEQDSVDRQLQEESKKYTKKFGIPTAKPQEQGHGHLDPEWLALEVFTEETDEIDESDTEDEDNEEEEESEDDDESTPNSPMEKHVSVDTHLAEKMLSVSVSSNDTPTPEPPRVAQSPYGSVTSSLSLLEMLVRLTGLQQFQQTSHLSIPDYILTFFLEETSATGLRGEARWQAKHAAKQRMGFDPFTDTPTKEQSTPNKPRKGML